MLKKRKNSGQAILIVILIMVVVLTVGLSVASRMIINMKSSTDQASSQKALSAAEAGVEKAIKEINNGTIADGIQAPVDLGSGNFKTTYTTAVDSITASDTLSFNKDESHYFWLSKYSIDPAQLWTSPWSGTLAFHWDTENLSCNAANPSALDQPAALEIAIISGTRAMPKLERYVYDPCAASRSNNFSTDIDSSGSPYKYRAPKAPGAISISNGLIIKITALYHSTTLLVTKESGANNLPDQGKKITSTGLANDSVKRKIYLEQRYEWLPDGLFPYILFSP